MCSVVMESALSFVQWKQEAFPLMCFYIVVSGLERKIIWKLQVMCCRNGKSERTQQVCQKMARFFYFSENCNLAFFLLFRWQTSKNTT